MRTAKRALLTRLGSEPGVGPALVNLFADLFNIALEPETNAVSDAAPYGIFGYQPPLVRLSSQLFKANFFFLVQPARSGVDVFQREMVAVRSIHRPQVQSGKVRLLQGVETWIACGSVNEPMMKQSGFFLGVVLFTTMNMHSVVVGFFGIVRSWSNITTLLFATASLMTPLLFCLTTLAFVSSLYEPKLTKLAAIVWFATYIFIAIIDDDLRLRSSHWPSALMTSVNIYATTLKLCYARWLFFEKRQISLIAKWALFIVCMTMSCIVVELFGEQLMFVTFEFSWLIVMLKIASVDEKLVETSQDYNCSESFAENEEMTEFSYAIDIR